jgi:hypothetical protein
VELARRRPITRAAREPMRLPVAVSTATPIRPESVRPRSWVTRTLR